MRRLVRLRSARSARGGVSESERSDHVMRNTLDWFKGKLGCQTLILSET